MALEISGTFGIVQLTLTGLLIGLLLRKVSTTTWKVSTWEMEVRITFQLQLRSSQLVTLLTHINSQ